MGKNEKKKVEKGSTHFQSSIICCQFVVAEQLQSVERRKKKEKEKKIERESRN